MTFDDFADLREGPELHPALLPLLPLVGTWRGVGKGGYPTLADDFDYQQQVRFGHDGRPFLSYESRSWILDEAGNVGRPAARETGFWRAGTGDDFEVLITQPTGITEVYIGTANSATQWELRSDVIARTATAKEVSGTHRLYGIVEGDLLYAMDMAAVGEPMTAHISARLQRIGG